MRAGTLRHKITIQTPTETQDAAGEPDVAWGTLATVWADFGAQSGTEQFTGGADRSFPRYTVRCRYRSDVTAKMRVLDANSVAYDIELAQDPDGKRRELVMQVVRRT